MRSICTMKLINSSLRLLRKFSSGRYWDQRYTRGGNSGPGSYGRLAEFKAKELNKFVRDQGIRSVIEFGCGDGNQLSLAAYPLYTGYDVSPVAIRICRERFAYDKTKQFFVISEYTDTTAELALSLDVIFHLVEDKTFDAYMSRLFNASSKFVIIYSSNQTKQLKPISKHVKHRQFTNWVEKNVSANWSLVETIPNAYPYDGNCERTSFSDFFIFRKY